MTRKSTAATARAAHSVKGEVKTGRRTVSKTAEKVPTKTTKGIVATTGSKSAGSGVYAVASPRTRRAGARPARQPAGLPQELQEYLEAFVAELETTLVPAIAQRLRAGAARLSPRELAKRMLDVAPAPAPANKMAEQVGPEFYDTAGVTVVLAPPGADRISKQAVEHRRKRRSLLALQTSDGRWIYPTWQFRDHDVMPGLAEVLAIFAGHPSWSVATWLTTPTADLQGLTAVRWLDERRDRNRLLRVARRTAHRWAA